MAAGGKGRDFSSSFCPNCGSTYLKKGIKKIFSLWKFLEILLVVWGAGGGEMGRPGGNSQGPNEPSARSHTFRLFRSLSFRPNPSQSDPAPSLKTEITQKKKRKKIFSEMSETPFPLEPVSVSPGPSVKNP